MTGSTAIRPRPPAGGAFDSRTVAPPVRVDLWEKATARFLVPMRIATAGSSIIGTIGTRRIGAASFCRLSATPHAAVRDRVLAAGPGAGNYKVAIGLHGRSVICQHGRRVSLGPGDLTVYDTSEAYSVTGDVPFGLLVSLLPQELVDLPRERVAALAATPLAGEGAALVRAGLLSLTLHGDAGRSVERVADDLRALLRRAVPARLDGPRDTVALLDRAKETITARLADPRLNPDHVAALLGVSRRYLYALFATDVGPIAGYIRSQRLERARALLVAAPPDALSVADVAASCGFADPAHFSRLFRRAYGASPAQYRGARGRGPARFGRAPPPRPRAGRDRRDRSVPAGRGEDDAAGSSLAVGGTPVLGNEHALDR
jgi:AraC-like DNA-binding protein